MQSFSTKDFVKITQINNPTGKNQKNIFKSFHNSKCQLCILMWIHFMNRKNYNEIQTDTMLLLVCSNTVYIAEQREVMLQRVQISKVREKRMNSKETPCIVKYELKISIQNQVALFPTSNESRSIPVAIKKHRTRFWYRTSTHQWKELKELAERESTKWVLSIQY